MPNELSYKQATEYHDRVSREALARNRRTRRYGIIAAATILAAGVGAFAGYSGIHHGDSGDTNRNIVYGLGGETPWKPRLDGPKASTEKALSLAEAKAQADIPVLTPSANALSSAVPDLVSGAPAAETAASGSPPADNAIRVVWLDHQGDMGAPGDVVHIEYNHLDIAEAKMDSSWDGPRAYRGMIGQNADANAYLATVKGSTAYVAPPNNNGVAHPGYVMFMNGDVQITLTGYYPASDLVAIANSLE